MIVDITSKTCLEAVEASQATFQASQASKSLKRTARSIKPIVFLSGRKGNTLAQAYGLSLRSFDRSRKRFGLRESVHPSSQIGKRKYYMIIEVNPNAFSKDKTTTWSYLCKVMAHELAHLIDDIFRCQASGAMTDSDQKTDHDEVWQMISKYCGGNDGPIID